MALGKLTRMVAVGICVLACSADPGDTIDEDTSSSEEDSTGERNSSEEPSKTTDSEKAGEDACNQDGDPSTPEGALANYARLRGETECTTQVTSRGKPITLEFSIE